MHSISSEPASPPEPRSATAFSSVAETPDSDLEVALRRVEARIKAVSNKWRNDIRHSPGRSVVAAAAGGYLFRRLPVGALLATGLKLAAAFTPPTLIALGICKVAEYCKHRDKQWASSSGRIIIATDAG